MRFVFDVDSAALAETDTLVKLGKLHPDDVLEQARSSNSALHGYFTWDDTEAAHQHRINQAKHLIKAVIRIKNQPVVKTKVSIVVGSASIETPAVVSAHKLPNAVSNLYRLRGQINSFRPYYAAVPELLAVFQDIDLLIEDYLVKLKDTQSVVQGDASVESILSRLGPSEKMLIRNLDPSGASHPVLPNTAKLIRSMYRRYPDIDIIALGGSFDNEYARLTQLGRQLCTRLKGRIAA